ncbi:hypothetical protein ABZV14_07295 [Streptosporangium canum]|uniref:hypothetical protein n=1 Tax=Streptosporangium canum TaxID=324952 RepID=UPI0033B7D629
MDKQINSNLHSAADADSDGGRGLLLVDLIATGWGAYRDATGNVVWFRLPATAPKKPGLSL